nr:hypothetical protein [Mesorhizobium sangaii]
MFYTLGIFALLGFGILAELAINGFEANADGSPIGFIGFIPLLVFISGLVLPSIALVVRRAHGFERLVCPALLHAAH